MRARETPGKTGVASFSGNPYSTSCKPRKDRCQASHRGLTATKAPPPLSSVVAGIWTGISATAPNATPPGNRGLLAQRTEHRRHPPSERSGVRLPGQTLKRSLREGVNRGNPDRRPLALGKGFTSRSTNTWPPAATCGQTATSSTENTARPRAGQAPASRMDARAAPVFADTGADPGFDSLGGYENNYVRQFVGCGNVPVFLLWWLRPGGNGRCSLRGHRPFF